MRVGIGDIHLYFDVEGPGLVPWGDTMEPRPTLVLLHGGPGADHTLFKPEFSAMASTAQVVYLDQRGSGRSDRGDPARWTWSRWADDVADFCRALDIRQPVLVGTSSGGLVGLMCAASHPELVAGLVLDSTFGAPMTMEESLDVFERRGGRIAREVARRYLSGDTSPTAIEAWKRYGLPLYGSYNDGDMSIRRLRAKINDEVQARFRAGLCGSPDMSGYLAAITCPTLILAGQDDPVTPSAAASRLAAGLVSAPTTIEVVPNVGHGVFRQAPARAFALLREFLHRVTAGVTIP
jgi:pimeloyl-ACP methyl ester carboxylesterase